MPQFFSVPATWKRIVFFFLVSRPASFLAHEFSRVSMSRASLQSMVPSSLSWHEDGGSTVVKPSIPESRNMLQEGRDEDLMSSAWSRDLAKWVLHPWSTTAEDASHRDEDESDKELVEAELSAFLQTTFMQISKTSREGTTAEVLEEDSPEHEASPKPQVHLAESVLLKKPEEMKQLAKKKCPECCVAQAFRLHTGKDTFSGSFDRTSA